MDKKSFERISRIAKWTESLPPLAIAATNGIIVQSRTHDNTLAVAVVAITLAATITVWARPRWS